MKDEEHGSEIEASDILEETSISRRRLHIFLEGRTYDRPNYLPRQWIIILNLCLKTHVLRTDPTSQMTNLGPIRNGTERIGIAMPRRLRMAESALVPELVESQDSIKYGGERRTQSLRARRETELGGYRMTL